MSALTDRIAAEHRYLPRRRYKLCACGVVLGAKETMRAHVATVTEAAVREQVARDIEAELTIGGVTSYEGDDAARIARGGAA